MLFSHGGHLSRQGVCAFRAKPWEVIYLAAYGAGSVLEYHELIVVCALVQYRRRLGVWVSHIYSRYHLV